MPGTPEIPLPLTQITEQKSDCSKSMRISTANKARIVVRPYYKQIERMEDFLHYRFKYFFLKKDLRSPDQITQIFIEVISMAFSSMFKLLCSSSNHFHIWINKKRRLFHHFGTEKGVVNKFWFSTINFSKIYFAWEKNNFSIIQNLKKKGKRVLMFLEKDCQSLKQIWRIKCPSRSINQRQVYNPELVLTYVVRQGPLALVNMLLWAHNQCQPHALKVSQEVADSRQWTLS